MKNTETLNVLQPGTDAEELFDLTMLEEMEDDEYLLEMIDIFLWEAAKELKEMKQALTTGAYAVVSEKAHKVKSNAGIIQANTLGQVLDNIERTTKNNNNSNGLLSLVDSALYQYQLIEKELKNYVKIKKLRD